VPVISESKDGPLNDHYTYIYIQETYKPFWKDGQFVYFKEACDYLANIYHLYLHPPTAAIGLGLNNQFSDPHIFGYRPVEISVTSISAEGEETTVHLSNHSALEHPLQVQQIWSFFEEAGNQDPSHLHRFRFDLEWDSHSNLRCSSNAMVSSHIINQCDTSSLLISAK